MKTIPCSVLLMFAVLTIAKSQIKVYSNYDFVPGPLVLFDDNFKDDQNGEFPAKWDLESGQGVVNKIDGESAFIITDGNPSMFTPRLKTASYLTDPFTIEFDYYVETDKRRGVKIFFQCTDHKKAEIYFGEFGNVFSSGFAHDFSSPFPNRDNKFDGQWHHAEVIFKNGQIKTYIDKVRITNMPGNAGITPISIKVGGGAGVNNPIIFKNFRIASGGTMNMTGGRKKSDH